MSRQGRSASCQPIVMVFAALLVMAPFMVTAQTGAATDWAEALTTAAVSFNTAEPGEYHFLSSTADPDVWYLTPSPTDKSTQEAGSFHLHHSAILDSTANPKLRWPQPESGGEPYEWLVVGTLFVADGSARAVGGVRLDFVFPAEDGALGRHSVLAVLFESVEIDQMERMMRQLTELFEPAEAAAWTRSKEPPLTSRAKSTCDHYCHQDFAIRTGNCLSNHFSCGVIARVAATACRSGCRALPNPVAIGICLVGCTAAQAGALNRCDNERNACLNYASAVQRECLDDCPPEAPIF